jgi:UDP-N-acetylglucosamine acyltransferase
VSSGAELDEGVQVGAFAVIGPKVRIGSGTVVHHHATIVGNTTLGPDCKVFQYASIGAPPQDLKYAGEDTRLVVGSGNTFREFCTINKGTAGGHGETVIGDENLFMAYVHVAHDCIIGNRAIFAGNAVLGGHVTVADDAVFGGMAGIHQFCRVGRMAMLGAGSIVVQDVPPFCLVQGDRAAMKGLNIVALKRRNFSAEAIAALKNAHRVIFREGLTVEKALSRLRTEGNISAEVEELVRFVETSERGVVR